MRPTFKIITPGLFTTVQDLGRYGFQQYGMPVSGAMDTFSHKVANLLVDNPVDFATIECTFNGPEIEILSDTFIAVAGGETSLLINNQEADSYRNHKLHKGDMVKVGNITTGCRVYIAFAGGIDVPVVMNSRSTYTRAKVGGYLGRPLKPGDILSIGPHSKPFRKLQIRKELLPKLKQNQTIRVIGGTEVNSFLFEGVKTILTSSYTITNKSDRMGYRLEGPAISHTEGPDIISSGICNGAIQVPGDGKPIIMLADRQTVGGYTKIANVITTDLPLIGQMKPGDTIQFEQIHLEEAHKVLLDQTKTLHTIIK